MDSKVVPKGDVNNQYEKHTVTVTKHLTSQENVRRLAFFPFHTEDIIIKTITIVAVDNSIVSAVEINPANTSS